MSYLSTGGRPVKGVCIDSCTSQFCTHDVDWSTSPTDCSVLLQCVFGEWQEVSCIEGLYANADTCECDYSVENCPDTCPTTPPPPPLGT